MASTRAPRPRVWSAIVVGLAAPVAAMVVMGVLLGVIMLADLGIAGMQSGDAVDRWLSEFGSTPLGLATLIIPSQLVLLLVVIGAALLSREPFRGRLALTRSALPLWSYPILMIATLAAGMIGGILTMFLPAEWGVDNQQLEMIYTALARATGGEAFLMIIVISLIPGLVEEMLDRGYVQSRLLRRWPPALAIGFSTLVFAVAHFDPMHCLAVLPLGAWLGIVAWRAGSIVPSIICHMFNNAIGFLLVALGVAETTEASQLPPSWAMALAAASLIAAIFVLVTQVRKPPAIVIDLQK